MARYTVPDAARVLDISPEAVRNRLSRGTLESVKEGRTVFVLLPRSDRSQSTGDVSSGVSADIVDELRDRVRYLERQVEEEREAGRGGETLLPRLMDRMPELEPVSEPRESPESVDHDSESVRDTIGARDAGERRRASVVEADVRRLIPSVFYRLDRRAVLRTEYAGSVLYSPIDHVGAFFDPMPNLRYILRPKAVSVLGAFD
jgi:hypothetical protein